jgi:chorismate mutase/prephenate dehydratase
MDLDDWRSRINDLDDQILSLLNQRGHAALQIGELKRQQDSPYFVPEREAQLLDRLLSLNRGPLGPDAVRAVWREILSASLALENPLPVGYLGPAGTFTHAAAMRRFGTSAKLIPLKTIADIFEEVERSRADYGVVPVENSTEGPVNVTLDRLIESETVITGELTLEISQHLLSRAGELGEVKIVCSHPQALAQCRQWLLAHLPEARMEEMSSTTAAVERAKDDPTVAAVASELAARTYDVPMLRKRIEERYEGCVGVSTDDPADAWARGRASYRIAWPEADVRTEARLELTSDADSYHVVIEVLAEEVAPDLDAASFRSEQRYVRTIPRLLA